MASQARECPACCSGLGRVALPCGLPEATGQLLAGGEPHGAYEAEQRPVQLAHLAPDAEQAVSGDVIGTKRSRVIRRRKPSGSGTGAAAFGFLAQRDRQSGRTPHACLPTRPTGPSSVPPSPSIRRSSSRSTSRGSTAIDLGGAGTDNGGSMACRWQRLGASGDDRHAAVAAGRVDARGHLEAAERHDVLGD